MGFGRIQVFGKDAMGISNCILLIALYGLSQATGAVESHCTKDEIIVFNCRTGSKIVSVCASPGLSKAAGYLQYRFGSKDTVELLYPEAKRIPDATIQAGTLIFAGGGGAYLRFKRDSYGYVVYTAIGRGWGEKASVAVEKEGKIQANLPCKKTVISELGPDFFEKAGLVKDEAGFDLP